MAVLQQGDPPLWITPHSWIEGVIRKENISFSKTDIRRAILLGATENFATARIGSAPSQSPSKTVHPMNA